MAHRGRNGLIESHAKRTLVQPLVPNLPTSPRHGQAEAIPAGVRQMARGMTKARRLS
jgi:hypothetical protein